jgi:hypothetical protein
VRDVEENEAHWRASQEGTTLSPEHLEYLHAAAEGLQSRIGSHSIASRALVINLGPIWPTAEAGRAFADSISEMKEDAWEQPPGLGICPLDTLFNACTTIHRWLSLQDDNVAVRFSSGFSCTLPAAGHFLSSYQFQTLCRLHFPHEAAGAQRCRCCTSGASLALA